VRVEKLIRIIGLLVDAAAGYEEYLIVFTLRNACTTFVRLAGCTLSGGNRRTCRRGEFGARYEDNTKSKNAARKKKPYTLRIDLHTVLHIVYLTIASMELYFGASTDVSHTIRRALDPGAVERGTHVSAS